MNRNRFYLGILISVILAVIFYMSYGMLNIGREEPFYSVSVILDNSSSDRWNAFREGVEQGVKDNKIHVDIVSTSEFSSLEEECSVIKRELENGADGIIVDMCESDDSEDLLGQIVSDKAMVLINSDIAQEGVYPAVTPDHRSLGAAIAEVILEKEGSDLSGVKIGILSGGQQKLALQQRLQGFEEIIDGTEAEIAWRVLEDTPKDAQLLKAYIQENPVDLIAALDNEEIEWAVDFLLENKDIHSRLYGEGRSEKAIYYLDKGMIEALIVPNEYYMGYQSIVKITQELEKYASSEKNVEVDFLTVTKEKLYDPEYGKILFPVVR